MRKCKRLFSGFLGIVMGMMMLPTTVFAEENEEMNETTSEVNIEAPNESDDIVTINVWSFTDEVTNIVQKYIDMHPDCGFRVNATIINPTEDTSYVSTLQQALESGDANAPDIFAVESSNVLEFSKGWYSQYAAPYESLGIDIDAKIKEAEIAPYSVDIGTNRNGEVVGLGFQSTSGAFIYRRSIAKDVWETDDPAVISKKIGGGTGNLDTFWTAAEQLKDKGYSIISGDGDLWHAVENSADQGWIVDGALTIDPKREAFLDYSKKLKENGYHNDTRDWSDEWFNDMCDKGSKKVFGFFGPAWFINYTLAPNCGGDTVGEGTYGDWAVCESPMGFYWGGTWLFANKDVSDEKVDAVKTILEWITLDCTKDGLQYMWANGTLYGEGGTKDTVTSGTVMAMSDGRLDFLGGQNMFDIYVNANKQANGKNVSVYDEFLGSLLRDETRGYVEGFKSKTEALNDFKLNVESRLGLTGTPDEPYEPYEPTLPEVPDDPDAVVINVWSFTDEIPMMIQTYIAKHPDCGFRMNATVISITDGSYQPALDDALMKGGENAPDIYAAEASFVLKYSQGEAAAYAAPYKDLEIDVDAKIKEAEIAPYSVEIGTNKDGDVVGLGYQTSTGAFIYRRSIAKDVWGTDDPAVISKKIGGGTGNLDTFWTAAEQLKDKGYSIISGDGDLWHAVENSADQGWIVDGALTIDPKREAFLDYSKKLKDNGYHNDTQDWQDAWFDDMQDKGSKKVFGFFGPAWFINYTLAPNCGGDTVGEGTYGDWAVCESPMGFNWGGTWLFANRDVSDEKADSVKTILEWITLDCTKDGLQYMWANGTLYGEGGTKDTVASGKVMAMSDGRLDFLGGQNMFDIYVKANKQANGKNVSEYDEFLGSLLRDETREYVEGFKTKTEALNDFKLNAESWLGLTEIPDEPTLQEAVTINVWSYTYEIPMMIQKYIAMHPDCGFRMNATLISTTDGEYQIALDKALMKGGENAPDIYAAEASFVLKYSQGEAAAYAAPYKNLGIDVDAKIKQAEIAPYSVEIGTNKEGEVVGLGYQSTSGAFIYRRSIAKKVWGTDDPAVIAQKIGAETGNLDAFWTAAEQLKDKGYSIISGDDDLWHAVENSAYESWMTDGILSIDPKREAFLDYSKKLKDNGYHNDTQEWYAAWFDDMKDKGSKKVFGFFGPAWLINYTLAPNCGGDAVGEGTYGDWAVCESPMGFFWGGTWLFANRDVSDEKADAVKTILEWITLDCTKDGLQYMWANGTLYGEGGTKDAVASGKVMAMSDGRLDFLGGQNMFDIYIKANKQANGKNISQYDEVINASWRDQVREYSAGTKTKAKAIADFKSDINYIIGVDGFAQKPSSWYKQNNKWYHYDSNCVLQTGWQKIDGKWYYLGTDGTMVTGWQKISGKWYFFNGSGVMVTGWQKLGTKWYYFTGSGAMVTGWQKLGTKWYYFTGSGAMVTGWQKLGTKWYFFASSGAMATGWQLLNNKWYYFETSGAMVTGWKQVGTKWYYFETSGTMAVSKWINGTYYVKANGVMATNEWVDGGRYYVDGNGKWVPGKTR